MTEIKHFYTVREGLAARMAQATLKVTSALGEDESSVEAVVSLRLLLGAQMLLNSLDTIPWNVASANVQIDKPTHVKPKHSLAEVKKAKTAMLSAWGVINFYREAALAFSMPRYFQHLVPVVDRLITSAEHVLEYGLQRSVDAAPVSSPAILELTSSKVIRLLQGQIKKTRGAHRGRLTLSICLLDDAQKLSAMCARTTPPFIKVDDDGGHEKPEPNPLEESLTPVDRELLIGVVHRATVALLLPVAQGLYDQASETSMEVAVAARDDIAEFE
jgi:hypothetical protein